jgi:regulator of sirC expression with transglutaminase-like and TPR domain
LAASPNDATYHYHLGLVYEMQKHPSQARKQLQRALEINPQGPDSPAIRKLLDSLS